MLKLHTNVSLSLRGPFSVGEKIMTDILISYLRRRLNSADSDLHWYVVSAVCLSALRA